MNTVISPNACYEGHGCTLEWALAKPHIRQAFASRLRRLLAEKNKKPSHLAKAIGVNPSAVSNWLSETSPPTLDNVGKVADFLGVRVSELLEEPSPLTLKRAYRMVAEDLAKRGLDDSDGESQEKE